MGAYELFHLSPSEAKRWIYETAIHLGIDIYTLKELRSPYEDSAIYYGRPMNQQQVKREPKDSVSDDRFIDLSTLE